jgi:hypothetical protein
MGIRKDRLSTNNATLFKASFTQQPCLICGRWPTHAHHIRYTQPRGLGLKMSDEFTVALCAIAYLAPRSPRGFFCLPPLQRATMVCWRWRFDRLLCSLRRAPSARHPVGNLGHAATTTNRRLAKKPQSFQLHLRSGDNPGSVRPSCYLRDCARAVFRTPPVQSPCELYLRRQTLNKWLPPRHCLKPLAATGTPKSCGTPTLRH